MSLANILNILKPNVTSLGYALFLAINAAGVWGGVFPFLPMEFQTPQIIFSFFVAQSLVFFLSYFASAFGAYFFPGPTRRFLVIVASIPYFLGWCCLIGAMYFDVYAELLVTFGGGLLGLGSAGFFMLWQRLFASQEADVGNRDLMVGTAYAAIFYFSLYLLPTAITAFLIPLVFLPLFGLCIVLKSRTIEFNQPMFEDVPRNHPSVYKNVIRDYWRSAISLGALGFCCGITRALAIGKPAFGSLVNIMSMTGSLIAAVVLLFLWQFKNIRLNITAAYRFFFPFVITAFLLFPFFGESFFSGFSSILYAFYSCGIMLMMIQCAQASRDRGINPVFIYGFFGGVVYFLHDLGFMTGSFAEHLPLMGFSPLAIIALLSVYLLGLMYFVGQGGFGQFRSARREQAERIELVSLNKPSFRKAKRPSNGLTSKGELAANTKTKALKSGGRIDEPQYRDRISKQSLALQQHYRLSVREAEVMELIARGNSVVKISRDLVVSENTIRTHSKRIYSKLAIHKKQELLDLIEVFRPEDIRD